jgi:hypothetical protein
MKEKMLGAVAAALLWSGAAQAADVASLRLGDPGNNQAAAVFLRAQEMRLPALPGQPAARAAILETLREAGPAVRRSGTPRLLPGHAGGKALTPAQIVPFSEPRDTLNGPRPNAVGGSGFPFSTSRIELMKGQISALYPNRAVGRLGFRYKTSNAMCSASLIGPGLLLTAAHCVADFGSGQFLPDARWAFVPGYYKGKGAYGTYTAQAVFAAQSYLDGTAKCDSEVICPNDVALLVLRPNKKRYPGAATGWLGVGLDGYGFSDFFAPAAPVTQLGYPGGLDNGAQMIRNDAVGFRIVAGESEADSVENTMIGSPLDGGSSGGPWVLNFGVPPSYDAVPVPLLSTANTVVGVTSWGDASGEAAVAGSSPLTSENLGALIAQACTQYPAACAK